MDLYTSVVAAALAAVHLVGGKLRFLEGTPRSVWLSLAGGVSVAYVFLHLLPDSLTRASISRTLIGYGCSHRRVRPCSTGSNAWCTHLRGRETASHGVFWVHLGSFGLYNVLFGYLLHRREENLLLYAAASALHFVVTDYGMRLDHRYRYESTARWCLLHRLWAVGRSASPCL